MSAVVEGAMDLKILAHVNGADEAAREIKSAIAALQAALKAVENVSVEMDVE